MSHLFRLVFVLPISLSQLVRKRDWRSPSSRLTDPDFCIQRAYSITTDQNHRSRHPHKYACTGRPTPPHPHPHTRTILLRHRAYASLEKYIENSARNHISIYIYICVCVCVCVCCSYTHTHTRTHIHTHTHAHTSRCGTV